MAVDSQVTPDDIRGELNEVGTDEIADSVIEQKITNAEVVVGGHAASDADQQTVEYAVRVVAAYDVLTADTGGWQTVAAEVDLREQYDVAGFVEQWAQKRAEALALVSPGNGQPSLEAVGDRYP